MTREIASRGPTSARIGQLLGPSTGGIRAHVAELSHRLCDRGMSVVVLGPAHVMEGVGEQAGIVEVPSTWSPVSFVRARRQLGAQCGDLDLLHVHGLKAGMVALATRHRPPMVLTIHNLVVGTRHGVMSRVLHRLESFVIRRADQVIVISDEIGQRLRGTVPDDRQTFVLPVSPLRTVVVEPADVRRFHGVDRDAPLVVIVARHHPQKDLSMFLRAMGEVRIVIPDARAIMVGDGPDRRSIEAERARLGLDEVVVIAGHRPNPVDEMNAADVVALSSKWEGSPLVVAECLTIGRPLVTTAVGTVTRHLTDGVDARIVPVGDHLAFGAALVEVARDPLLARRLGAAGRTTAHTTFAPDHLVDGVVDVYSRMLPDVAHQVS